MEHTSHFTHMFQFGGKETATSHGLHDQFVLRDVQLWGLKHVGALFCGMILQWLVLVKVKHHRKV